MSSLKQLASQTAIYGLSQILGRFVNYLLVPLYTTIYTPGEYGVVTLLYSYVTFLNVLLTYGMETAFFRYASKSDNPNQVYVTVLRSVLTTSLVFVSGMILFSGPLSELIRLPEYPEYITWFSIIIAVDAFCSIPFALLRQQNRPIKFAIIKNINIFSNILLNLYFLLLCPYAQHNWNMTLPFYSPSIGVGYVFISNLISSLITVPLLYQEILEIRKGTFDGVLLKEMLIYALPLMVVGFAGMINETLDRTIIGWFYDDVETGRSMNGIYGANYKLSILMSLFIQAFRYAAEPFFFSHAQSDDKRTIYATVMEYFVLVCLALFLLVTLFIDYFQYFIGPAFREGLGVVPILLLANMFLGIYYNLSIWYKLSDQTGKGAWISLTGAVITIVLNVWWIPLYGYMGCAWATFVCYFSMAIICYIMGMKYYPIPYRVGKISLYILLALVIFAMSNWAGDYFTGPEAFALHVVMLILFIVIAWVAERKNNQLFSIR